MRANRYAQFNAFLLTGISGTCSTAAAANATQTCTVIWTTAFADTNYRLLGCVFIGTNAMFTKATILAAASSRIENVPFLPVRETTFPPAGISRWWRAC
jgi:hypothetical protein